MWSGFFCDLNITGDMKNIVQFSTIPQMADLILEIRGLENLSLWQKLQSFSVIKCTAEFLV